MFDAGDGVRATPLDPTARIPGRSVAAETGFWGSTDRFTSINAGAGVRLNEKPTISLTGTNLSNEKIQQHVFGDVISRKITAQIRFHY